MEDESTRVVHEGSCLFDNKVLGKVAVDDAASLRAVDTALRESLGEVPNYGTACVAEFRHGIEFISAGRKFQVLLCYGCGQVQIAIDGKAGGTDQAYEMGDESALDAILTKAGIALAPKRAV